MKSNGIRRWKRYPEFRDSGVEWLGGIANHWKVKRLKFACHINPSKSEISALPADTEVSFLPMECIGTDGTTDLSRTKRLHEVRQGFTYFRDGDVIVAKITPCFENGKGALCNNLVNGTGFGTTELHVLRPLPDINPRFVFYATISEPFRVLGTTTMYGAAGQQRVSEQFIRDFPLGLPTADEQCRVATFLSHKTTTIDTLVTKKERLIELLQEKRAALISHAATKGLDPKVPMKDSGVEWLGKIPVHWRMMRLKFCLFGIEQGWSPSCENRPAEPEEWGVMKVGCVNGTEFNADEQKALLPDMQPIPGLEIKSGDVLMSRANTRKLLGSASVVGKVRRRLLLCDKLYRLKVRPDLVNRAYLVLALGAAVARFQMEREATGASDSMQNIAQSTIWNLSLPLPDTHEQERILDWLNDETSKIDALIAKVRQAIERLCEYRTALISAAVTGKIDVREEVA